MKILFVSEYYPPIIKGGGEINLQILAEGLANNKCKVIVLTSYNDKLPINEVKNGVNIIRKLKNGKNPESIISNIKRAFILPRSIIKEINKINENIDIIHLIGNTIIVSEELRRFNKVVVATVESYPALCPKGDRFYKSEKECGYKCTFGKFISCQAKSNEFGKMKNYFYLKYNPLFLVYIYFRYKKLKNSLKYCNIIAISNYVNKVLLKHDFKSEIVSNIIEIDKFKKTVRNHRTVRIAYFGSLTRYKGPHILLESIKKLEVQCILYGNGILKNELLDIIKKNNLNAEIRNPIPYNEIPEEYSKADIIVFPSIWPEPFGRIPVEAMAAGKPFIASNIGGITETAKDSGLLVKPGDVKELRNAIIKLLDNESLRLKLGCDGIKEAKKYNKDKVINQLLDYYNKISKR